MELALDYRIYKSYQVHQKIGKGAYGQVFKATDKKTSKGVAIKKICDAFQNLTDAKRTYRQLAYQLQLSHPCIIKLERVISSEALENGQINPNKNVYAIFELMEMDLAKTLHHCKLESLQRKFIGMQIIFGLKYLHQSGLVHRDIKPSNILVDQACNAKICDFGLVRKISEINRRQSQQVFTEYIASRWYRAPEILLNGSQASTTQIDMWSLGCILAEMILGYPIFNGKNTLEQLEQIFKNIGMPIEQQIQNLNTQQGKFLLRNFYKVKHQELRDTLTGAQPQELDLIEKLLVFNPNKRLSASQALNHCYFRQLKDSYPQFQVAPAQISDNSLYLEKQTNFNTLNAYRDLIQSLCVSTARVNSSGSQARSDSKAYLLTGELLDINSNNKNQKSTRESNHGLKLSEQGYYSGEYTSSSRYDRSMANKKSNAQNESLIKQYSDLSIFKQVEREGFKQSGSNIYSIKSFHSQVSNKDSNKDGKNIYKKVKERSKSKNSKYSQSDCLKSKNKKSSVEKSKLGISLNKTGFNAKSHGPNKSIHKTKQNKISSSKRSSQNNTLILRSSESKQSSFHRKSSQSIKIKIEKNKISQFQKYQKYYDSSQKLIKKRKK